MVPGGSPLTVTLMPYTSLFNQLFLFMVVVSTRGRGHVSTPTRGQIFNAVYIPFSSTAYSVRVVFLFFPLPSLFSFFVGASLFHARDACLILFGIWVYTYKTNQLRERIQFIA
jgi:hypothetical protein